jgi:hypothetical protein
MRDADVIRLVDQLERRTTVRAVAGPRTHPRYSLEARIRDEARFIYMWDSPANQCPSAFHRPGFTLVSDRLTISCQTCTYLTFISNSFLQSDNVYQHLSCFPVHSHTTKTQCMHRISITRSKVFIQPTELMVLADNPRKSSRSYCRANWSLAAIY